jgi:hypothetical protein
MGRPLNKKFFANTNYAKFGTANVGGESIATVNAVPNGLAGMTYLTGGPYTIAPADISAPQITGGAKPVLTFQPTSATAGTVIIVSAGSGYTSAPSVTVRGSLAGGSQTVTMTGAFDNITLTTTRVNGLKCEAQIGSGGAEVTTGDVIKQVNGRSYKVQTSDGTAVCKLVTTEAKDANQMSIKATDSAGNTYFVAKLTARKATLVPAANVHGGTTTIGSQFASGTTAMWTFGAAVVNTTVTIENQ